MFALLYGFSQPSNVYYYYRHLSLYYRANEFDVKLPKIHLIINKLTKNNSINSNNNNLKTLTNGDNNNNNYTKPDSELRWEFIFDLLKKFPQVFHLRNNERIPETIEEFKNEYLIEIGFEQATTNIVREAVRSHSPLLTVKNPHNIRPIIAVANTNTTPSSTTTSGYSSIQQTPSSSTSSSASSNSSSQNNTNNISSNHKITATYPCPTRLIVTNSDANQQIIIKKNNDDVNNNNNSNNIEFSNAIMFDKILDKIVDRL
jgi:hypothetical protein